MPKNEQIPSAKDLIMIIADAVNTLTELVEDLEAKIEQNHVEVMEKIENISTPGSDWGVEGFEDE